MLRGKACLLPGRAGVPHLAPMSTTCISKLDKERESTSATLYGHENTVLQKLNG